MTTQTIVLISIMVVIAIAAGATIIAVVSSSGDSINTTISAETARYKDPVGCPKPPASPGRQSSSILGLTALAAQTVDITDSDNMMQTIALGNGTKGTLTPAVSEASLKVDLNYDGTLSNDAFSEIVIAPDTTKISDLAGGTVTDKTAVVIVTGVTVDDYKGKDLYINQSEKCWSIG